jgi:hypothetical protein
MRASELQSSGSSLFLTLMAAQSQWLFSPDALAHTPTVAAGWSVDKEVYDRARGVELLFRLGSSLALSVYGRRLLARRPADRDAFPWM